MENLKYVLLFFGVLLAEGLHADVQLNKIELPPDFSIEIYTEGVRVIPAGALLVSDDQANLIYRISYII